MRLRRRKPAVGVIELAPGFPAPSFRSYAAGALCDHGFVVRSYYRRRAPGFARRHVRWSLRCVACHEYIGRNPVPSKPDRVTLRQRRRDRQLDREYLKELRAIRRDLERSGKPHVQYVEELDRLFWGDDLGEDDGTADA